MRCMNVNDANRKILRIAVDCRMIADSGIGCYLKSILNYFVQYNEISFLLIGDKVKLQAYAVNGNCEFLETRVPIFSIQEAFHFPVEEINKCDCFYSPNYNIPLGIKIPIFSTIHDVVFLDVPIVSHIKRWGYYLYLQQAISRSRLIFTVSDFSKKRILHHFLRVPEIIVTHNGVAEHILNVNKMAPYFDFPYFLYVGNIKPHKGLKILLEAYQSIESRVGDKKLVIVGNMDNFKTGDTYIQSLIEKGVLGKNIIFTGRVSDEELIRIMRYALLLVQPSVYEGFGIPPLESMHLGTPVLLSDISVFKEIYKDFPVQYFRCGDVDDLTVKLQNQSFGRITLSEDLKDRYSYRRSAEIILYNIQKYLS